MGLDVSHDAWSGAYSRFNRFRETLAKAANIHWPTGIGKDQFIAFPIDYQQTHPGLYTFFCHSDCDGEICSVMCAKLADEMEALLPQIEAVDQEDFLQRAKQWIAGCREAAARHETLEFM